MDEKKLAEEIVKAQQEIEKEKSQKDAVVKVSIFLTVFSLVILYLAYLNLSENPNSQSKLDVCKGLTNAECQTVIKDARWLKSNGYTK